MRVLERADAAKQTSLQAVADVDPMEGEQTWPTQEELADAEGQCVSVKVTAGTTRVKVKVTTADISVSVAISPTHPLNARLNYHNTPPPSSHLHSPPQSRRLS